MSNTTNTSGNLTRTTGTTDSTPRVQWDPNKTYTLNPTDTFSFTGPEFNFIYRCLLTYGQGSITDMKAIRAIQDCFTVVHGKFVEMVENGSIREQERGTAEEHTLTGVSDITDCTSGGGGCASKATTLPTCEGNEVCFDAIWPETGNA